MADVITCPSGHLGTSTSPEAVKKQREWLAVYTLWSAGFTPPPCAP